MADGDMGPHLAVLNLTTRLERRGPAAALVLTDEQVAALDAGKVPPIMVSIGTVSLPLRIGRMGGENLISFAKAVRSQFGVEVGDDVEVKISLDTSRLRKH